MTTTPPGANPEYSRGQTVSGRVSDDESGVVRRSPPRGAATRLAALGVSLLGALLLLVAEFTTLFVVRTAAGTRPVESTSTGSHHAYALIPIALLVVVLTLGVWQSRSRVALLAIGLLGVIALLIALLGDLPDAQASGLVGSITTHFASATSSPSTGLYLETLGAVVLMISSGLGLMLLDGSGSGTRGR
jgi:hypothetical protein